MKSRIIPLCSRCFTLIELLVVIAIISILMAMLLPALKAARDMAKRSLCMSGMKHICLAAFAYGSDSDSKTPLVTYDNTFCQMIANPGGEFAEDYLKQKAKLSVHENYAEMVNPNNILVCPAGDAEKQGTIARSNGAPWNLRYTLYNFTGFAIARHNGIGFEMYRSTDFRKLDSRTAMVMDLANFTPSEPSYVANSKYYQNHGSRPSFSPLGINCGYGDGSVLWVPRSDLSVPTPESGSYRPKAYGHCTYVSLTEGSTIIFFTPTGRATLFSSMNGILW